MNESKNGAAADTARDFDLRGDISSKDWRQPGESTH